MKWIGISGGWRKTTPKIENDVRNVVSEIMKRGDGIVSGGALNVDFIALDEALKHDSKATRIKIFLPTTLEKFAEHYRKYAQLGTIASEQAENLISQLTQLKQINPKALIENPDTNFTEENKKDRYYERNASVVEASDELVAFLIKTETSEGLGTADTIKKAETKGIPVNLHSYDLTQEIPMNKQGGLAPILLVLIILAVLGMATVCVWYVKGLAGKGAPQPTSEEEQSAPEKENAVSSIPSAIENNCIGFLTADPRETATIPLAGAGWTRPHPGPFSWGMIEKTKGINDFDKADNYIITVGKNNVAILGTIWPFADWDQKNNPDCKVSELDQFYPKGNEGIPAYRCKPQDTEAYKKFLTALVEKYDGDGIDDMPGLKIPVKYWEILNEPEMKSPDLTFFIGNENDYFEILKESYLAIKGACPDCKVLHAGNAGSQASFLSFWDKVYGLGAGNYFDIANTHIIGMGDTSTLNAKPLKNLLDKYNMDKPIWVTEVQYENSNADVKGSVSGALNYGAEKIFFVSFKVGGLNPPVPGEYAPIYKEAAKLCPVNNK